MSNGVMAEMVGDGSIHATKVTVDPWRELDVGGPLIAGGGEVAEGCPHTTKSREEIAEMLARRASNKDFVMAQLQDSRKTEELEKRNRLLNEEVELLAKKYHTQLEPKLGGDASERETYRDHYAGLVQGYIKSRIDSPSGIHQYLVTIDNGIVTSSLELTQVPRPNVFVRAWRKTADWARFKWNRFVAKLFIN